MNETTHKNTPQGPPLTPKEIRTAINLMAFNQMKIALHAIREGKDLAEALEIALSYPPSRN